MMATFNSELFRPGVGVFGPVRAYLFALGFAIGLLVSSFPSSTWAATSTANPASPNSTNSLETARQRFKRLYVESRQGWQRDSTNSEAGWQFARACFDWADFAVDDKQRAAIAEEGIAASRRAIQLAPKSAAAHYYLGLNLGQLAQTKLLGALKLIDQMETAWLSTLELDPKFDYAGAHRALTLLYRDAPGWPTSVGSRTKARRHLQSAIELSPEYPGNRICWLETQLRWGEVKAVRTQLDAVEQVFKEGRIKFNGEQWARDWTDWERQLGLIKTRVAEKTRSSR